MTQTHDINEYIESLRASPRMGDMVVYHTILPSQKAEYQTPRIPWSPPVQEVLEKIGIPQLYSHQARAIDKIRTGSHVVTATPTASGKTLIYNLPVLENICKNPLSKALYLFPLKALAQDQLRTFKEMADHTGQIQPTAAIYDGDTTAWHRKRIRETPPNVIMTNPEMLHLSFLPHHPKWSSFLSGLDLVVVDEVHTYRGIMGSHMAQVFRRLLRICRYYGASPTFIFSSATVANPGELAEQLTGLEVSVLTESGAPRGKKHLVFVDPQQGPAQTTILLLKAALHRKLRSIVYAQSRKMTELIALWAGSKSGRFAHQISPYRAGFLPEERRKIESRLSEGDLLAVISTSALELGIDIGDLDLCLLTGYPGTIVATWQRSGRVGRTGQDSAVILIGGEDALDQYFMRNPLELVTREPEAAVVNPHNPEVMKKHLECAAAELPLKTGEPFLDDPAAKETVRSLEHQGILLRSGDGSRIYSRSKAPHRKVDLRGSGSRYVIYSTRSGEQKGEIDAFRAFRETHPGAVYIHNGKTYLVDHLDLNTQTVKISPANVKYYTRVRTNKNTEILEVFEKKMVQGALFFTGRLKVTDQVTGYETRRINGRQKINVVPLDLPPQTFETEGIWFRIPLSVQQAAESKYYHFMGGIHAIEHAAIGIFPLLVMCDRNDLGGISTPFHPQADGAVVFVYDGIPGGAGLSRQAFKRAEGLVEATLKSITTCPCEFGCPSCVHSPKCGSGNRPIDKAAAIFVLEGIQKTVPSYSPGSETAGTFSLGEPPAGIRANPSPPADRISVSPPENADAHPGGTDSQSSALRYGVLDIETRRSAAEVGGWHRADLMGVSCVVVYDSGPDEYLTFLQDEVPLLVEHLQCFDLIVGFNISRFDYKVLTGLSDFNFSALPTLDILQEVHKRLGYRLSLDHLAQATLGAQKSADGLQALKWWKEGRLEEIIDYCRMDVKVTRDLYRFGLENGYLLFKNKAKQVVRVPVEW